MVKSKIPKDWIGCPSKGDHLVESKFVVFKTPLSERYDNKLPSTDRFYPEDLFYNEDEKPGLWIDLTNTDRYYAKKEIEEQGCIYKKIECHGHGSFPTREQVKKFISAVREFLRDSPDGYIGVHCTHGFNRTGYMVVSFLVTEMNQDVAYAVESFAKARPPGIYRQRFIVELFRNHGRLPSALPAPKLPSWISNLHKSRRKSKPDPKQSEPPGWRIPENGQGENYASRIRQRYDSFETPCKRLAYHASTKETGPSHVRFTEEYDWSQSSRSKPVHDDYSSGSGPIRSSWRSEMNPSRETDFLKDQGHPWPKESDVPRLSTDHSKGKSGWPALPRTILPGFLSQDSNPRKPDVIPWNKLDSDSPIDSKGPGPIRSPQDRLDSNPYQRGTGLSRLCPVVSGPLQDTQQFKEKQALYWDIGQT